MPSTTPSRNPKDSKVANATSRAESEVIEEGSLAWWLQKYPRELRDKICAETIAYGIVIEYTQDEGQNEPPYLNISHVPAEPNTPLVKIEPFSEEVKEQYNLHVAKLRSSIHGQQIDVSAVVINMLKTSRVELHTSAKYSRDWLGAVDPCITANIRCLRLGKSTVWGNAAANTWWHHPEEPGFANVIKEQCPALEEVILWMPDDEISNYSVQAPRALCDLLEEGRVDKLRFLLNEFDNGTFEDHPLLDNLLRKEHPDWEEFEECYDGNDFLEDVIEEESRTKALGDRFHYDHQPPRHWDEKGFNCDWPNNVVYTFRRMTEADHKRNERWFKWLRRELDDYVEGEFD